VTTRRRIARRPTTALRPRLTWRQYGIGALIDVVGGTNRIFDLGAEGSAPSFAALGVFGDFTIRRLRWEMSATVATVEVTPEATPLWFGVTVVSSDAFNTGSGALPDPQLDSADWMAWGVMLVPTDPDAGGQVTDAFVYRTVDNRSMRKVNENSQVVALVFSAIAGFTIRVNFAGRILVSHGRQ